MGTFCNCRQGFYGENCEFTGERIFQGNNVRRWKPQSKWNENIFEGAESNFITKAKQAT